MEAASVRGPPRKAPRKAKGGPLQETGRPTEVSSELGPTRGTYIDSRTRVLQPLLEYPRSSNWHTNFCLTWLV